jgi:hypothetical protein
VRSPRPILNLIFRCFSLSTAISSQKDLIASSIRLSSREVPLRDVRCECYRAGVCGRCAISTFSTLRNRFLAEKPDTSVCNVSEIDRYCPIDPYCGLPGSAEQSLGPPNVPGPSSPLSLNHYYNMLRSVPVPTFNKSQFQIVVLPRSWVL